MENIPNRRERRKMLRNMGYLIKTDAMKDQEKRRENIEFGKAIHMNNIQRNANIEIARTLDNSAEPEIYFENTNTQYSNLSDLLSGKTEM